MESSTFIHVQPLDNLPNIYFPHLNSSSSNTSTCHVNQPPFDTIKINLTNKVPERTTINANLNGPVVDSYRGIRFVRDLVEINRTRKTNLSKSYPPKSHRVHLKAHTPTFRLSENDIKAVLATNTAAQNNSNDDLIKLTCFIQNQSISGLVDTGASSNYIAKDTLTELDPLGLFPIESHAQSIKVGDNRFVTSIGRVTLPIIIDQHGFATSFIILQNLSFEIILGMQFLSSNNAIIDTADKSVYFNISQPLKVSSSEKTIIPAFSCIAVSATTEKSVAGTKIIKNVTSFNQKYGAFVSQGTINCDENHLTILVSKLQKLSTLIQMTSIQNSLTRLKTY